MYVITYIDAVAYVYMYIGVVKPMRVCHVTSGYSVDVGCTELHPPHLVVQRVPRI